MAYPAALKRRVEELSSLPTLPRMASSLLQTINDPSASASDVAHLASRDMSLSARMLRLANSAFYGVSRQITSVTGAVVILGMKVVYTLVLSLTVFDMFPRREPNPEFDREEFWRHCFTCGLIARLLAHRRPDRFAFDFEEAFCAGLLHDLGKVVMEQYIHADFQRALHHAHSARLPTVVAERRQLGYTHEDVAQWLLESWNLPPAIKVPATHHHTPLEVSHYGDITALCHFADWFSHKESVEDGADEVLPPLESEAVEMLGVVEEDLAWLKERLPESLERSSDLLRMTGDCR